MVKPNRKTEQIGLRITPQERREWEKLARDKNMNLTEFVRYLIRRSIDDAAEKSGAAA